MGRNMRIDNIPKYRTLWYEDEKGDELDFDISHGFPDMKNIEGDVYQHADSLVVTHSICLCNNGRKDKWPVRFLKWALKKLPYSWKSRGDSGGMIGRGETTLNCAYPIVKYLVEQRKWHFAEACIAAGNLCERCMNIAIWEAEGEDMAQHEHYMRVTNTHCLYCRHMDPEHHNRYVMKVCYRKYAREEDVTEEYKWLTKDRKHADA